MTEARGRLDPAVAAARTAVRTVLAQQAPGRPLVVACSGGPDSMALAAAAAFVGPRDGHQVRAVVVDHGLFSESAEVAARVAGWLGTAPGCAGIGSASVVRVVVGTDGGPEAAARAARYQALEEVAATDDAAVLLGHTRDDQAETVLLGLARGSGTRSLGAMRAVNRRYLRPLLALGREDTVRVCSVLGLPTWSDPANDDLHLRRVRVRHRVLPVLEQELGPGIAAALARTAEQAALDADALDALAGELYRQVLAGPDVRLQVDGLAAALPAVRRRALRLAALAAGCPDGDLAAVHVLALESLVVDWHGQQRAELPGRVRAQRHDGHLLLAPGPRRAD